jgi:two-component system chemotaxis response regulator CheB
VGESARPSLVVGVGASAGGVEALQDLLARLDGDLDAAVLVVLHTSTEGPGVLPALMQRGTPLTVVEVRDEVPLEAGVLYVAMRDRHLLVVDGTVKATRGPKENGFRPAIDPLFRSIATSAGRASVGLVLSGSNDDGALGLAAIHRAGGCTGVQDPTQAAFPYMPAAAADEVPSAEVLPLADMPAFLSRCAARAVAWSNGHDDDVELERSMQDGPPAPFTCPECGGSLWEDTDAGATRYVCRVGHAFNAQRLLELQDGVLEAALWTAIRTMEERADLSRRLSRRMQRLGNELSARHFEHRAREETQHVTLLRSLIEHRDVDQRPLTTPV